MESEPIWSKTCWLTYGFTFLKPFLLSTSEHLSPMRISKFSAIKTFNGEAVLFPGATTTMNDSLLALYIGFIRLVCLDWFLERLWYHPLLLGSVTYFFGCNEKSKLHTQVWRVSSTIYVGLSIIYLIAQLHIIYFVTCKSKRLSSSCVILLVIFCL